MSNQNSYYLENNLNTLENDDFYLNKIIESIKRNKKLIGSITGFSILISGLISLTQKLIWQGEFQIVLSEKQRTESGDVAATFLNENLILSDLSLGQNKEIKTDIEVLKSPSILIPVYELVKSKKKKSWKY